MADTGAQMMIVSPDLVRRMGVRDEDFIPMELNVFAANGVPMEVLGGIPVKLSVIPRVGGKMRESCQLAYVAMGVH